MDHCTRRIVGFGVHRGVVDGGGLCRMFNRATRGHTPPTCLSADHDPLYRFHQWQANLRILDVKEIKTVPYTPRSHPSCFHGHSAASGASCLVADRFTSTYGRNVLEELSGVGERPVIIPMTTTGRTRGRRTPGPR